MAYEEINPGIWTPKNENDFLEGIFIRAENDVGPQNSMLYHLEKEGKPISVWGSVILDQRMVWIRPGSKIKITYLGLADKVAGKNQAKKFKVEVDVPKVEEPKEVDTDSAGLDEDNNM